MTNGLRTPRKSESPFDRLGARVIEQDKSIVWPLERGASVWLIAHLVLGDWRLWRDVLVSNNVADALDLEGVAILSPLDTPAPAPFEFGGVPDDAPSQVIDLASPDELGTGPQIIAASPELRGVCVLVVEDVTFDTFTLAVRAPDASVAGDAVAVSLADFEGAVSDVTQVVERTLFAAGGEVLQVRFTLDAWLCVWLARTWPVTVEGEKFGDRTELVIAQKTGAELLFVGA